MDDLSSEACCCTDANDSRLHRAVQYTVHPSIHCSDNADSEVEEECSCNIMMHCMHRTMGSSDNGHAYLSELTGRCVRTVTGIARVQRMGGGKT